MTGSEALRRSLAIEVPAGEVERETQRIAQSIQRQARIPGFRPGKAPLGLVRQRFETRIREEMLDTLVPAHLKAAFERANLDPVGTPTLAELKLEPGAALTFTANFEVMPPIELGNYRAIRVAVPPLEVAPAEVEAALEALRQRHGKQQPAEAEAATDGLLAVVEARRIGAKAPDGTATAPEAAQQLSITVGAADTLPEFNAALRGMRPGEERELEVAYPADFPTARLAGQKQSYHLKLLRLEETLLPELSDAFVQEATGVETAVALRQRVAENLASERRHEARHQVEEAIVDQLVAQSPFPVPEALVDQQVEARLERNLRNLARQGVDPRKLKLDWAQLRAAQAGAAEREVRAALLLERIAASEHIEASAEALEAELQRATAELGQTPEAARSRLTEPGVLDRIKNRIRHDSVLNFLVAQATEGGFDTAAGGVAKELAHS